MVLWYFFLLRPERSEARVAELELVEIKCLAKRLFSRTDACQHCGCDDELV